MEESMQTFTYCPEFHAAESNNDKRDIRDIDLFTGGLSEKPVVGGVVGPTFACILSRQFQHLKKGDRFWYENDIPPNAFSKGQLEEIRKSSLTRILCDNGGKLVRLLQPSPMLMPDDYLNAFRNVKKLQN
ncbi:peroxidase mlt-7 [Caerostris extrusa]|uniref:Peroxidase mlt-7 n=1 Tax=Caerostris extrusa TaxID=172846 RepID=A0AAV4UND6_CAEEX|nr:peroxidase mlt-7 [Caerostris extrusa]